MRRPVDLLLIVAILAAVGIGAYELGHRVDHLSNQAASQDSELNQPRVAAPARHGSSHRTPVIVALGVGAAAAALLLGSVANSIVRSRRRERWHAT